MTSYAETTRNAITLRGSVAILSEYLNYGINSILFHRGVYPPEKFIKTGQYGLTILMLKDRRFEECVRHILIQAQDWLSKNYLKKISIIITNVRSKEVVECWDFKVQTEPGDIPGDAKNPTSSKDLRKIQQEIREIMRQISATVSRLPVLNFACTCDLLFHTAGDCSVPEGWSETGPVFIQNCSVITLRSFSTGLHKMDTVVNFSRSP